MIDSQSPLFATLSASQSAALSAARSAGERLRACVGWEKNSGQTTTSVGIPPPPEGWQGGLGGHPPAGGVEGAQPPVFFLPEPPPAAPLSLQKSGPLEPLEGRADAQNPLACPALDSVPVTPSHGQAAGSGPLRLSGRSDCGAQSESSSSSATSVLFVCALLSCRLELGKPEVNSRAEPAPKLHHLHTFASKMSASLGYP
jgi:hypothetical protein